MTETPVPSPQGFKIDTWYKFILYIFGAIFILSFFVDVKSVNIIALRQFSMNTIALGMFLWIFDNFFEIFTAYIDEQNKYHSVCHESIMDQALGITIFGYAVIIISIIAWFVSVSGLSLWIK